eukprot:Clim_evm25s142 gene=Clim_evmTU25s142
MALSDEEVTRQIRQMVAFIEQEAAEKANEISVKAEEEFNIEKGKIVQQEKLKIMQQYERKQKNANIDRKIQYSNALNKSRLQVLKAKEDTIEELIEKARRDLSNLAKDSGKYSKLMESLVLEGCFGVLENEMVVVCREQDKNVVNGVLSGAQKRYTEATGKNVSLAISSTYLPKDSAGGVEVSNKDGSIKSMNTLEERLEFAARELQPELRTTVFGENPERAHAA